MTGCIPLRLSRTLYAAAVAAMIITTGKAYAQNATGIPTSIVAVPNAPLTITNCKSPEWYSNFAAITNRTSHALLSVSVQIRYFDQDGTVIGQKTSSVNPNEPLATGDDAVYEWSGGTNLSEPTTAIAKITCRLQEAAFTGQKRWKLGQKWTEKLLPLKKQELQDEQGGTNVANTLTSSPAALSPTVRARAPKVTIAVVNAWNDTVGANLLVHVALDVQGGASDATITPANLTLTMSLANGGKKQYTAMPVAAPTFQKINPLGNTTTTAYEVDPKDDIGRLGSVIVPAHATVKVVATFFVGSDVVANANDNRQVGLK